MLWSISQGCSTLTGKDFHRSTGNFLLGGTRLHHSTAPQELSPISLQVPLLLFASPLPSFRISSLPLGLSFGHFGVWVTPEEEAARGLFTAGERCLCFVLGKESGRQFPRLLHGNRASQKCTQASGRGGWSITASPPEPQTSARGALMASHPKTASKIIAAGQRNGPSFHCGRCTALKPKPGKIHPNQCPEKCITLEILVFLCPVKPNSTSLSSKKPRTSDLIRSRSQIRF